MHRALELALALRYCHDEAFLNYQLLHRDIKPKNLGLMDDGRLVLFDFGIARLVPCTRAHLDDGSCMTGMCGSLRYMAPEVALSQKYNHRSEAYSFAIVVWEMVALRRPYADITPEVFEQRVCIEHERPRLKEKKWPQPLCEILSRAWAPRFQERPDFKEVVDVMMTAVAEEKGRK